MNTITKLTTILCLSLATLTLSACDEYDMCLDLDAEEIGDGDVEGEADDVARIDYNGDGVPELVVAKRDGKTVTKHDFDNNGIPDLTITEDGGKTTTERDLDQDGLPDIKTFTEDSNGDGKIDISRTTVCVKGRPLSEQSMIDVDNDGKFDLSTLKIDTDGDGTLDYEEHRRDADGDGVPEELYDPFGG